MTRRKTRRRTPQRRTTRRTPRLGGGEFSEFSPGLALALGGAGLLGFMFWKRGAIMDAASGVASTIASAFDYAKGAAFAAALPSQISPWASQFLSAGQRYNVSPWALAAICYGESLGGQVLKPKGAGGTGDFIARSTSHVAFKGGDPSTGLPVDGQGWGRGLMQIDWGVHQDWFKSGAAWWDPQVNIDKAASILREKLNYFTQRPGSGARVSIECWRIQRGTPQYGILPWKDKYPSASFPACTPTQTGSVGSYPDPRPLSGAKLYEAAIAAYNVSYAGVMQALVLGLPAEAGTAHQQYVTKFLNRVSTWTTKFSTLV